MGSRYKQDTLTFTTPEFRRIPRPGPSRVTLLEQRVTALEAKCDDRRFLTWDLASKVERGE